MARTLILSNKQLNEIIGDGCYLSDSDKGENIYHNEVSAEGGVETREKPTTDSITKTMGAATNNWNIRGGTSKLGGIPVAALEECYTKKQFQQEVLKEMNSQLKNIKMNVVVPGENPMLNVNLGSNSEENLAYKKTKAKQSGDKKTYDAISTVLDGQRERIKSGKRAKAAAGMNNQFQKPGGTKNNTGTAHTPKNDSNITILKPLSNNS